MTTTLIPNAEAAHDRAERGGNSSLLLGLRAISTVLAGLGSSGTGDLVAEANNLLELATLSDDPLVAEAIRGVAHQLASLDAMNANALLAAQVFRADRTNLIPRLKAGPNVTIVQRADEFEIQSTGGSGGGPLESQVFNPRIPLIPRLKAGSGVTITQRADEMEIASTGSGGGPLESQVFNPRNPGIPRLMAGTNITLTRRADEFEFAGAGYAPESDQSILATQVFGG